MMSSPKETDKYLELNQNALQRSVDEGGTEEDIAFHRKNLENHLKRKEVEEDEHLPKT